MAQPTLVLEKKRRMTRKIRIPADFEPHARTIMAWAVHREWGAARERAEYELDTVIRAIAEDEPVMLLTPPDLVGAAKRRRFGPEVEIVPASRRHLDARHRPGLRQTRRRDDRHRPQLQYLGWLPPSPARRPPGAHLRFRRADCRHHLRSRRRRPPNRRQRPCHSDQKLPALPEPSPK